MFGEGLTLKERQTIFRRVLYFYAFLIVAIVSYSIGKAT